MTNSILMGSRIAPCSFRSLGFHLLSVQFYYFYCTTLTSRLMEQTLLFHGWNFCIKEYLMLLKNLLKTTKHINMTHIELLTGTNISFLKIENMWIFRLGVKWHFSLVYICHAPWSDYTRSAERKSNFSQAFSRKKWVPTWNCTCLMWQNNSRFSKLLRLFAMVRDICDFLTLMWHTMYVVTHPK